MRHFCLKRLEVLVVGLGLVLCAGAGAVGQPAPDKPGGPDADAGRPVRRVDKAPKAGEMAPTFALKSFDGKREVSLESSRGKRPVVLFFGSYT